ncbi:unnamed protein product [Durusdinium trenchii]|uniref:Protoporphyrinogen oxidase n=1 Tax=Durusdinium trenchii TaxID=1381693 RepID=A0ABP0RWS5_9DINO
MAAPKFCILGGGVSGLTCARLLQRSLPHAEVTVLSSSRLGAPAVCTSKGAKMQVLEQGFHNSILVNKNGREALGLLKLLKLEDQVLSANIEASARRHIFHGRVQLVPGPQHVLLHGPALLAEPLWPRSKKLDDESVFAFVTRRASKMLATYLADPICRGQLAGDAKELSVRTCFPRLWHNEQRFGSVFLGAALSTVLAYRRRSWMALDLLDPLLQRVAAGGRCYSFRAGLSTLVGALEEQLMNPPPGTNAADLRRDASIETLEPTESGKPRVQLRDGFQLEADCVIASIQPTALGQLLKRSGLDFAVSEQSLSELLLSIHNKSVAVVNLCYEKNVLKEKRLHGAGYFVGSEQHESMLAMSWDSQLYPEHGGSDGAHMTLYFTIPADAPQGVELERLMEQAAIKAVTQQLGIQEEPTEIRVKVWQDAVPQYLLGHHKKLQEFNAVRRRHLPWLQVSGPGYFGTRNIADEIIDARELTDSLARRFARFPGLVENELEEDITRRMEGF